MKKNISERKSKDEQCCYRSLENGKKRLVWEITSRCNLSCRHCFVNTNSTDDIELVYCMKVIDYIREANNFGKIMLTGGEPFIRTDIFDILSYIKKSIPDIIVDLTTNMTLLDESKILKLHKIGIDELTVSLDGVGEKHDKIRGMTGCFEKVIRNIESALRNRLYIDIVCVVSSLNVYDLEEIADMVFTLKCSSLTFSGLIDRNDKSIDDTVFLNKEQTIEAFNIIKKIRLKYINKMPVRVVGFTERHFSFCNKNNIVSISSDGWIERCLLSQKKIYRMNIKNSDLNLDSFVIPDSVFTQCY
jgi:MoaA/NifB/PqqE/SkfB family radical SAM enzyme